MASRLILSLDANISDPENESDCVPEQLSDLEYIKSSNDDDDMLKWLYMDDHKSPKWYRHVFLWALSLAVVNGWLLYRCNADQNNQLKENSLT